MARGLDLCEMKLMGISLSDSALNKYVRYCGKDGLVDSQSGEECMNGLRHLYAECVVLQAALFLRTQLHSVQVRDLQPRCAIHWRDLASSQRRY